MALLEGDERSEMPSMSWNSVIKGSNRDETSVAERDVGAESDDQPDSPSPPPPPPPPPVAFSTPPLTPTPVTPTPVTPTSVTPTPVTPTPVTPTSVIAPVPPPPTPTLNVAGVENRAELSPQPAAPDAAAPDAAAPEVLPRIIEATPPTEAAALVADVVAAPAPAAVAPAPAAVEPAPAVVAAPVAAPVPAAAIAPVAEPNQTLSLPPTAAAIPQAASAPAATAAAAPGRPAKQRKDRSGSIARVGFFLLIVAALASAAVIFGRPYLFPADWETNALEYAEPIEVARGSEFAEAVLLTPQPTQAHHEMVAAQLLGDPAADLPMWRALGMAGSDSTDDATMLQLISGQSPVLYSTADGQVYYDESFTRSDRATLISRAVATAALDQDFSFSADAPNRSLDDEAITEANVRQQAALIAEAATGRATVPTEDMAALAFLPAVLDYRVTAPSVFVDLLPPVNDVAPNPLNELGLQGAGPLRVPPLEQIPSNSLVSGDAAVGSSIVTDRSFWYLSFASHLDATTAYRMSNDLQSAGLQMVDGPTGRCAVATLAAKDAATNATLLADLGTWAAATAPELGATVAALPDSNVQLRSCDPTSAFTSNIRFGVSRELIAWRAIELEVTNLVIAEGGTEADVATTIARIASTPTAVEVAQLPAGTAPGDLAAAARAAAIDVIVAT